MHTTANLNGLPAGAESDDDPEAAVVREFREETGLEIQVEKMLKAVSTRKYHHVSLIYLCSMAGGEFRPSLEVSEMRYFHIEQLPAMLTDEKKLIRDVSRQLKADLVDELA
jgi:ADP-ribose pyrophosphatase YjhB (NUDIX family)